MREALLQLEASNLVKIVPHRGAVVTGVSLAEIEDIFQLRLQLEPSLLVLSAPHLTAQDFQDLGALSKTYSDALETGADTQWGDLNGRFHLDLLRHADRPRSLAILSGLLQDCERPNRIQISNSADIVRAVSEHTQILALCEAGKIEAAAALLRGHIEHVAVSLIGRYRSVLAGA